MFYLAKMQLMNIATLQAIYLFCRGCISQREYNEELCTETAVIVCFSLSTLHKIWLVCKQK